MINHELQLQELFIKNKLPHAVILTGNKLVTEQIALKFSQWLFCEKKQKTKACSYCKSCKLFLAGTSLDFLHLAADEGSSSIKIEQVRELVEFVKYKSQFTGIKLGLLSDVGALNKQAANALLKTLEEPPAGAYLILTVTDPKLLLPTILSRCVILQCTNVNVFDEEIFHNVFLNIEAFLIKKEFDVVTTVEKWLNYDSLTLLSNCWLLITEIISNKLTDRVQYLDYKKLKTFNNFQSVNLLWKIADELILARKNLLCGGNFNIQLFFENLLIMWQRGLVNVY